MSVVEEIREQQRKALSTMSFKEKLAYFWDYYKIHTLVAVALIIVAVTVIYQLVTSKDYAFYATMINTGTLQYEDTTSSRWAQEFMEYAEIDPNEYQVYIDASIALSDTTDLQYMAANQQKLVAMMQAGEISAQIAETETFEQYAQFECFFDLEEIMSAEQIEKYRPYFYYTDAATFDQDEASFEQSADASSDVTPVDPSALTINHLDPSTMEKPVAVGVVITDSKLIRESDYYKYLDNPAFNYQGYPSEAVLGIPLTCKDTETAVKFLEYLNLN